VNEHTVFEYLNANIVLIGEMLAKLTHEEGEKLSEIYYNADGVLMSLGFPPEFCDEDTQDANWEEIERHLQYLQYLNN